jgi:hypothetical protein
MTSPDELHTVHGDANERPDVGSRPLLEYVCYPAGRNHIITILTTIFLAICVLLVWLLTFSLFMVAVAIVILAGSMAGFYTRTRYQFYDDHFTVATTFQETEKSWSQYRSYYPDRNGVLLSPFLRPTRLENFRGIYIKFNGNKDDVMGIIRSRISFENDR